MDRILTRIEGSDARGDSAELQANKVMDQFEQHQTHVDAQIGNIEKFTADMERALGNSPGSSEGG